MKEMKKSVKILTVILIGLIVSCGPVPQVDVAFGPDGVQTSYEGSGLGVQAGVDGESYYAAGQGEKVDGSVTVHCDDPARACIAFNGINMCSLLGAKLEDVLCRPTDVFNTPTPTVEE